MIEAVKQIRNSSAVLATFKRSLDEAVAAALFLERSLQNQMRVVEGEERRRWLGARLNYSEETCQDVHASEYDRLTAGDVEKSPGTFETLFLLLDFVPANAWYPACRPCPVRPLLPQYL